MEDICNPSEAIETAERLHDMVQAPYEIGGRIFQVTTSIGIALYPEHGEKTSTLLRHADEALYEAKKFRNSYRIYNELSEWLNATKDD